MIIYPLLLDDVKPCTNNFPYLPQKDSEAMKAAGESWGQDVDADYNDPRLGGIKKKLFRWVEFASNVKAPDGPIRGYAPVNACEIELLAAKCNRSVKYLKQCFGQIQKDGLIHQHRRLNGSIIAVIADEAHCERLREIIKSEDEKKQKAADLKAARAQARKKLAESLASSRPFSKNGFFSARKAKKSSFSEEKSVFKYGKSFKTAHFSASFVSKMAVLRIFELNLEGNSSSSYIYMPCADSGYSTDDDDVDASLFEQDEAKDSDTEGGPPNAPVAPPNAPQPLLSGDDPPASADHETPDPAYEKVVRSFIEEFCDDKCRPAALRKALNKALEGASPATATRLCLESLEKINDLIGQGKEIDNKWFYLRETITKAAAGAKTAHDNAPRTHYAPAKPAPALSETDQAAVDEEWAAMNDGKRGELLEATKALLRPSQRDSQIVNRFAKNLLAERMGFKEIEGWKATDQQRQAENLNPRSSRPSRPGRPARPLEAGGRTPQDQGDGYDALSADDKAVWLSKAKAEIAELGCGEVATAAIETRAKNLWNQRQT